MVSKRGEEDVTKVAEASKPIAKRVEAMSDRQKTSTQKWVWGLESKPLAILRGGVLAQSGPERWSSMLYDVF
jgi:hypothetical protein